MGKIKQLSSNLINKIAAGEVIESPASVVKELIENSLDAESTLIKVEIQDSGLTKILISDNGNGMDREDQILSIERHATSKIQSLEDLSHIHSFGFRGEALASIASISKLTIETGTNENSPASKIVSEAGKIISQSDTKPRKGTMILVEDLFFNTPVRKKFLKSDRSEEKKIKDRIALMSLANTKVRFEHYQDGKQVFLLNESSLKDRIVQVYGKNLEVLLLETSLKRRGIEAYGFISSSELYRSNRSGQFFYVNNRAIEIKYASALLKKSYGELIPHNAHPWCFLFFQIDPAYIDVNVHPTKKEIRFLDEEGFQAFFLELVGKELRTKTPIAFLEMKKRLSEPVKQNTVSKIFSEEFQVPSYQQNFLNDNFIERPMTPKPFSVENIGPGTKIDELTKNTIAKREFIPKKHFGIIFGTFILAEAEDGLYIIDQHTAHERIRYEEILNKFKTLTDFTQKLLTPIRLDLSNQDAEEILERKKDFERVGIYLDSLGEGTILVREVPSFLEPGTEKEVILDFLNKNLDEKDRSKELYDLMAKCIACRTAIKKNDFVSDHILAELIQRLSYCENPSRCPHGRPTLIKLTQLDLEKMFHRK
ncbi:MAG: DNA mismatch repair endonuclease MutL [Leptospiraceae bacterium]|nr:DNA mismatch repair endonuclease MutL [Leptospiraceae bacterium]